ncbi:imidazole glycerol phosphate synthase subunit HisH [Qipengyuania sp. JC766]|uniref:imidazole glycerol phosphate synthase subunit HisH n=1 Tax=Qipengyuania sp. JC766 TaxID=3232139 RepID=UPI00345803B4
MADSVDVALIDYGAGNLRSVDNALRAVGADVCVTADAEAVLRAGRIVLPGVGSFGACAQGLRAIPGMVEALEQRVRRDGAPFLGICVGMQLLATQGLEFGAVAGLDWIAGAVVKVEPGDDAVKVPHMGWNDVMLPQHRRVHPVIESGEAYFLHSYHFVPTDGTHIAALTEHGGPLVAAVAHENILGLQFHPEKSQRYGLSILERFLEWAP